MSEVGKTKRSVILLLTAGVMAATVHGTKPEPVRIAPGVIDGSFMQDGILCTEITTEDGQGWWVENQPDLAQLENGTAVWVFFATERTKMVYDDAILSVFADENYN